MDDIDIVLVLGAVSGSGDRDLLLLLERLIKANGLHCAGPVRVTDILPQFNEEEQLMTNGHPERRGIDVYRGTEESSSVGRSVGREGGEEEWKEEWNGNGNGNGL